MVGLLTHWRPKLIHEIRYDAGRRAGRVAVTVTTDRPGPVEGMVWLLVSGDRSQPQPVRISGRVAAAVECQPGAVVLPRASGAGWVYTAECVVRSAEDRPHKVEVVSTPEWASAVLSGTAEDASRVLTVTVRPTGEGSVRGIVRLLAVVDGRRTPIDIDVRLNRPAEGGS